METGLDKTTLYEALLAHLETELAEAVSASRDAAAYATDGEARAESKWDTQGLEASYLAAGQAGQAREWAQAIRAVQAQRPALLGTQDKVCLGALVQCDFAKTVDWFYLVPAAGGQEFQVDGRTITTLTFQTPLALSLQRKRAGDTFVLAHGAKGTVLGVQ